MITVKNALAFSEIGKKANQEDSLYPPLSEVKDGQRYFILCDGMGGHDSGEVASSTVAQALGEFFDRYPVEIAEEEYFQQALAYAYEALDREDTLAEKKMGTTLTCVILNPDGFLAAHIGDSRIYQIRNGQILFRTEDHSLVNDLLKAGEITEEEARDYPRKNIITRAMQPNSRRCKADIYVSKDLKPGDYIFLCCDGVLEKIDNNLLCGILGTEIADTEKISAIKQICDEGTKDNYTCWLIPVSEESIDVKPKKRASSHWGLWCLAFLSGLILGFACGYLFKPLLAALDEEVQTEPLEEQTTEINL